jgi:hypothetical protein
LKKLITNNRIRDPLSYRIIYIDPIIDLYAVESAFYNVVASLTDRMIIIGRGELNSGEVFIGSVDIWLDSQKYNFVNGREN